MGGVPVKHHSKGKVGRRRSHLALKKLNILVCSKCRGPVLPHRACAQCGFYKARSKASAVKNKQSAVKSSKKEQAGKKVDSAKRSPEKST